MKFLFFTIISLMTFSYLFSDKINVDPLRAKDLKEEGLKVAFDWLNSVDNQKYDKSYDQSGLYFKSNIPRYKWLSLIDKIKTSLGKVDLRVLIDVQYKNKIPKMPDGEYVLIRFVTDFEKKNKVYESLTLSVENNGIKVIGYLIK